MAKRKRGSDRQPVLQGFEEPEEPAGSGESVSEQEPSPATAGESLDGQTVYVIDAFALIYQVFYAMPNFPGPNFFPKLPGATLGRIFFRSFPGGLSGKNPKVPRA